MVCGVDQAKEPESDHEHAQKERGKENIWAMKIFLYY